MWPTDQKVHIGFFTLGLDKNNTFHIITTEQKTVTVLHRQNMTFHDYDQLQKKKRKKEKGGVSRVRRHTRLLYELVTEYFPLRDLVYVKVNVLRVKVYNTKNKQWKTR